MRMRMSITKGLTLKLQDKEESYELQPTVCTSWTSTNMHAYTLKVMSEILRLYCARTLRRLWINTPKCTHPNCVHMHALAAKVHGDYQNHIKTHTLTKLAWSECISIPRTVLKPLKPTTPHMYMLKSADFFIPPHMKGRAHAMRIKATEKLAAYK